MSTGADRQRRHEAAEAYRPAHIRLLLVAEAPPRANDRYFYFPNVGSHDSLFRYVARLVLGMEPTRTNKEDVLRRFEKAGVFLIDVCLDPILGKRDLRPCVDGVINRAASLKPNHIILIKATVYDMAFTKMAAAGLPVVDAMVPFPGSGQQIRFEVEMQGALDAIHWSPQLA